MAVLSEMNRREVWAEFMQTEDEAYGLTKQEVRAAIDAADDWVDTNAGSFNAALPVASRTALSARQKARLLVWVVRRRFEVG